jgi:hypothetical protein
MRLGLSGWQRIGIVSSVIWFVGFAGYIWIFSTRDASDFYGSQLGMCYTILNVDNEALQYIGIQEDRDKRQADNWTKYEKCRSDATALFYQMADNNYKGIPILLAERSFLVGWLCGLELELRGG